MRITTRMSSGTWLAGRLRERGLTFVGFAYATIRFALEQLVGRAFGRLGDNAASLMDKVVADRLHLVDGGVAIAGAIADGWPTGAVGTIGMLVLPVGGPAWAGLLPVGATYKGLRSVMLMTVRVAVTTPATCNVLQASACNAGGMTLSVLIVDDSGPFREVARRLLERQGLEVVGTAATSAEAVAQIEALHPHVALVDINLAGESGFEVTRQLVRNKRASGTAVILTSTHAESEYADLLAVSPAVGFVPKEQLSAETIRVALSGGTR